MASGVLASIDNIFARDEVIPEKDPGVGGGGSTEPQSSDQTAAAGGPGATHADVMADLNRFIDFEMEQRATAVNMTWRKLDVCFKWRALKSYLHERGQDDEGSILFARLRGLLRSNQLVAVEYDAKHKRIIRLNHTDCQDIEGLSPV